MAWEQVHAPAFGGETIEADGGATVIRSALRTLGWWIRDYGYAAVWQVRAFASRTDPHGFLSGDRSPVVVLPGVYETWRFLEPLIRRLHDDGHPVHVIDPLGRNDRTVPVAARLVADYLVATDLQDAVLLAHSKGGLVGKYVMSLGGSGDRITGMVAVAAPFAGSRYARLMLLPSLRIFVPNDPTILALAREAAVNPRIVSVYGRFDPHIPGGSRLDGAKNVQLDTGGHFRILAHPRVFAEARLLADGGDA
ncbi:MULTISPECIES: esterase/lipase family protein [unclassified Plantibacter]|uniref:esterase/lipase family protein n=1 Tax=unclassified Plantibacter TaxID=2624265 RepID=UPI001F15CF36|nr:MULTISPECIES: alpha/beta hydrolase [unclassified Plantibacter]